MLGMRSLLRGNASFIKNVTQQRNMSAISVPARSKVSKGEILFLSSIMVIGWTAVPAWVLCNIKKYREHEN